MVDESSGEARTLALFAEDGRVAARDADTVHVRRSEMRLCRPRQWGACWLAGQLWRALELDRFWAERLPRSRKGTRWDQVLATYRLIAPGSEWKLHRDWFEKSAMADLLGENFSLAEAHKLYACHDRLLAYKEELFSHLVARWRDLFNASFDVLLYDLTSTYFGNRRRGEARGRQASSRLQPGQAAGLPAGGDRARRDAGQLPLAYEVMAGKASGRHKVVFGQKHRLETERVEVRIKPQDLYGAIAAKGVVRGISLFDWHAISPRPDLIFARRCAERRSSVAEGHRASDFALEQPRPERDWVGSQECRDGRNWPSGG